MNLHSPDTRPICHDPSCQRKADIAMQDGRLLLCASHAMRFGLEV